MSTRITGGPRDGETLRSTIEMPMLHCGGAPEWNGAVLSHKRGESDPDGTAVYHFTHGTIDGREMTDAELAALPDPAWIPIGFGPKP